MRPTIIKMKNQRSFYFLTILYFIIACNVCECQSELTGHHIDGQYPRAKHRNGVHRTDIYFAAFFPMGTKTMAPEGRIGHGVMPAVRLAIKHINQSPNILRGYKLHMYWNDTECNPGVGLKAFFDMVHKDPKKLILFGAACSPVTDQIAKAAKHWNLVQITYADTHPMFTDKSFPHFFRVVPSDNEFNPPRLSIMRNFNWTRVGTLYQNEAKYALAHNDLVSELMKNNFSIVESQSFNDEITNQLEILDTKDVRIILGNFNETWARKIFCEAYRRKMDGKKFQWLIVGMYQDKWWEKGLEDTPCTAAEIQRALIGTMVLDILPLASNEDITISRRTPGEYKKEYTNLTHNRHYSRYHGYAYDGIWAAALAIQEVIHRAKYKYNTTINDFSYRSEEWEKLFIDALDKTSFEGVTGPVRFKDNSRRGNVAIKQMVPDHHEQENKNEESGISKRSVSDGMREQCIGEYSGVTRTLYLEQPRTTRCDSGSGKVYWVGDRPPRDQTIVKIEDSRVNIAIYVGLTIVASFGILLAIVFLGINIKFRNQRQIKMSSPNMNNLIITGCMLSYTSVIVLGLDSRLTSIEAFPYICTARAWMLMWGFTLSFGSMFSKTWRVHSIFSNVQINQKVMKDTQLYLVIGILVSVDLIVMTAWQIFDPFYRETKELAPYELDYDGGVRITPRIESCRSNYMTVFVGCIYAYKGLLMLFGAFLAWETRAVQIPALNDSKYVGMAIYNVAVMCILGVAVSFVLQDELNASFVLIAIFIIFCTTGTLCLVFVPKLIDLRRDPYGTMDQKKTTIKTNVAKKTPMMVMEDKMRIANKVNIKYQGLLNDLERDYKEACTELGPEEVAALLEKKLAEKANVADSKKDTRVSFAIDVNDISSTCSAATSSQNESSGAKKTEMSEMNGNTHSNDNGKPTINPENNLLAAPGSIKAMSQPKQIRQLPAQTNGHPQQLSHIVPSKHQPFEPNVGGVKYLPGEVLVGQSPNIRLPAHEVQQLQSSSSSVIHDHPSGARPSTSSTISSDHFSSDYFSSNNSHDCRHNEQLQHYAQHGFSTKPGGCFPPQEIGNVVQHKQPGETCLPNTNPTLILGQKAPNQTMQPLVGGGEKTPIHFMQPSITQYQHSQPQNYDHGAQFECQQMAAAKLCENLSHNYDSGDHSGENSNSEYTEDDDEEEEYEEEGYEDVGGERRMINIPQSSQNQSILKQTIHHPDQHGCCEGGGGRSFQSSKQTSCNPKKISKAERECQTYYEDQATQTEDEEEDDEVCHKHGCRYRRIQSQPQEDTTVLSGLDYPLRRRSQELSPSTEALWNSVHNPTTYSNTNHHSLHYPKHGNPKTNMHHAKLSQRASMDDSNTDPLPNFTKEIHNIGTNCGYESKSHDNQFSGGCEKSFSTSHDEIAYRGNVESAEILPIFHKLLEDKRSSHNELQNTQDPIRMSRGASDGKTSSMEHSLMNPSTTRAPREINGRRAHFNAASAKMRSCPDMSVRCDIVEYL